MFVPHERFVAEPCAKLKNQACRAAPGQSPKKTAFGGKTGLKYAVVAKQQRGPCDYDRQVLNMFEYPDREYAPIFFRRSRDFVDVVKYITHMR